MKCKKCGTEVDDRARFCPVCGEPMVSDQVPHAPQPPRPNYSAGDCGNSGGYRAPITSRSIPLAIILSIVTCGIYGIYWLYCLVNDLNTASGHEQDTSGGMVILFSIITCGIYGLYWYYTAGRKVNEVQEYNRQPQDTYLGILYLVLDLVGFGIVSMALMQNELNKVAGL